MGGVAKAVGGAVGGVNKGIKGENAGPSEGTIKRAQLYPELIDPVHNAINDATRLYQQGYSIPRMNQRQWEGIRQTDDWANQFGGRLEDVTGNIGNIAQGNRQGDAPGEDYLRSIYQGNQGDTDAQNFFENLALGKRGDSSHQNYFEDLYQNKRGDSSSQNFFEGVYADGGTPKEGWDTLKRASKIAGEGSGGLDFLRQTAGGQMLGANPYLDDVIGTMNRGTKDAYGNTIAGLEGGMSRAGGMGGSMEALLRGRENEGLATALAGNEANVRYADYGKERGYQEAARAALPGAMATETGAMSAAGGAINNAAYQRLAAQMSAAQQGQAGDQFQQELGLRGAQQAQAGDWQQLQARMTGAQQAMQGDQFQQSAKMQAARDTAAGYRSDIGQQLTAAGLMPGLGGAGFGVGTQLMNAGEYSRANLERQNNAGWEGLQKYLGNLGSVNNLFGQGGGAGIEQPASANAQMYGNMMRIASMMSGGGMGGGMFGGSGATAAAPTPVGGGMPPSDRRLKTDVEEVGHGLYRWRYIWGGPLYEGPMAQDVLEVAPELVGELGGYLTIPASLIRKVSDA